MNREKVAWAVSVVLIATLAFQLPGTLAHRDDDYAFVRTLIDVHRQVAGSYAEPVDEEKLRLGAIEGMLEELDPYSVYVPPAKQEEFDRLLEGSFKGVGIQLDQEDAENSPVVVVSPIEGSPAFKAGVLAGDIIQKVNGEDVRGLKLKDVTEKIKGPVGTDVTLTVKHETGEEVDLTMKRQEIILSTIKGYRRKADADHAWDYFVSKDPKIGYVRLTQFTPDTATKLKAVLESLLGDGLKGLILDLRFNPGGRLDEAEEVVDLFLDRGTIVVTKGRNRPEKVTTAEADGTLPYFPMLVLVNEHSASASEIVAGSLMDNKRALVLGTRTYGKGSVQEVIPLDDNNGELKLTVAYYYLPSGRLVHRKKDATDWGVEPQINVPMDEETQKKVMQAQANSELLRGPNTTQPTTKPTTQPVDLQLESAISTMIGHIVLEGERGGGTKAVAEKATQPVGRTPEATGRQ